MERSTIFEFGKPSIFLWAIYTMAMLNNQRVTAGCFFGNLHFLFGNLQVDPISFMSIYSKSYEKTCVRSIKA